MFEYMSDRCALLHSLHTYVARSQCRHNAVNDGVLSSSVVILSLFTDLISCRNFLCLSCNDNDGSIELNNCTGVLTLCIDMNDAKCFLKYTVPISLRKAKKPNSLLPSVISDKDCISLMKLAC
jgi:hypothetical protein